MKSLIAAVALLFLGCRHVIPGSITGGKDFDFAVERDCPKPRQTDGKVQVTYLGSGGVSIVWNGEAILIGPSFSNHRLWRAAIGLATFDRKRIKDRMDATVERGKVKAIFAGHSHYDHIGDIPALDLNVPVWVNTSGANMLRPYPKMNVRRIFPGEWMTAGTSFRLKAVKSGHAPQIFPCGRWPCVYAAGEAPEWKRTWGWHFLARFRGGQTYAFVIELLDANREVRYRIYYNDAAAPAPLGRATGEFDLAILTMAQWNWANDYPRDLLLTLRPRHVLVSHWDNFMRKDTKTATFIPTMKKRHVAEFLRIVKDHVWYGDAGPTNEVCGVQRPEWTMPVIGSTLLFEPR